MHERFQAEIGEAQDRRNPVQPFFHGECPKLSTNGLHGPLNGSQRCLDAESPLQLLAHYVGVITMQPELIVKSVHLPISGECVTSLSNPTRNGVIILLGARGACSIRMAVLILLSSLAFS